MLTYVLGDFKKAVYHDQAVADFDEPNVIHLSTRYTMTAIQPRNRSRAS